MSNTISDLLREAEQRMKDAGVESPDTWEKDTEDPVRCRTTKNPRKKNAWYVVHTDYNPLPVVIFGSWDGEIETQVVCAKKEKDWTPAERAELRRRIEENKARRQAEQERRYETAGKIARAVWSKAEPADPNHPYLKRKKVPPHGIRQTKDGRLIIPVFNSAGLIVSLQFISADGEKRFLKGGKTSGGYFFIPAKDGAKDGPLLIGEGYATMASCHEATGFAVLVTFSAGNLKPVALIARAKYESRPITICGDRDLPNKQHPEPGGTGFALAMEAARAIDAALAMPRLKGADKCDFNDVACDPAGGLEAVREQIIGAPKADSLTEQKPKLRVVTLGELLSMDVKPLGYVLDPAIAEQGLSMLHAFRGVGKTYTALEIACAVASGGSVFGRWTAPKARRVLYLDGEMSLWTMKKRLAQMVAARIAAMPEQDVPITENFTLLNPDLVPDYKMPNLATEEGQAQVEPFVETADLVIVDNLATLARTGRANNEDDWWPVQAWMLSLRHRGKSVLLVHHEGKNGTQRGTAAKEDTLNTVIRLSRPSDYEPEQGARFIVTLLKGRDLVGSAAESFEAQLNPDGSWTTKAAEDVLKEQLVQCVAAGMTTREIGLELGLSASTVSRKCQKFGIPLPTAGGKKRSY